MDSSFSRFEILKSLGGGGMGVVYLAEDTRLGRRVALKLLLPELTRDPAAKARFLQEAQAASSLDHPNICTIYDVGETEDHQIYLAMPYYEGETLKRRIGRGPLPLEEAMDIARQVAQGLAKAHRQGIVHRDVKPANLMVTGDGVVKILDFGVSELVGSSESSGSGGGSRPGAAKGTPAYMAPEQVRGDAVDPRTDLWSLGVVLYEMLTGRRPFAGDRDLMVLHDILTSRPEPLSRLRPDAPPELERIVVRLLAQDPDGRYRDAEALVSDLRRLNGDSYSSGTFSRPAPPRTWTRIARIAAVIALVVAVLVFLWPIFEERARTPEPEPTFQPLTYDPGIESFPSLSPAGDSFLYAKPEEGDWDIYLQRLGSRDPVNLTGDSPVADTHPAWSPDGQRIAFRSERNGGGIFLMGPNGERVRRLTGFGFHPAWSPDGREILFSSGAVVDPRARISHSRIWQVVVATGHKRIQVERDGMQPSWSPNGRRIAYWSIVPGSSRRALWTIPADGGEPVKVYEDESVKWNPVWSPDGRWLYFASDRSGSMNLWRIRINERTGWVLGDPEQIMTPSPWSGPFSLSRDGRQILYATRETHRSLDRLALDPGDLTVAGPPRPVVQQSPLSIQFGKASPDGRWIAFNAQAPQEDLFLVDADGGDPRQLTDDPYHDRGPGWLPDGRIVFFSDRPGPGSPWAASRSSPALRIPGAGDRGGSYGAWVIGLDGGSPQPLAANQGEPIHNPLPSPDGRWLACTVGLDGSAGLIDLSRPLEERIPEPLPSPIPGETFYPSSWSPDGKRLLGQVPDRGIFILSLETRQYARLTERGALPVWMSDGRSILFLDNGRIFTLDVQKGRTGQMGRPRKLYAPLESSLTAFDLSPDDRTLYLVHTVPEGDVWMAELGGS